LFHIAPATAGKPKMFRVHVFDAVEHTPLFRASSRVLEHVSVINRHSN